ncbi:MAG: hypothetical protein ABID09_08235 [Candidatus Omnitrophota bacterium]
MQAKKPFFLAVLVFISIFFAFLTFSMYRHLKTSEAEFNFKEATLTKENLGLRDEAKSMLEEFEKNIEKLTLFEEEKRSLNLQHSEEIKVLTEDKANLEKKIRELQNRSFIQNLRDAMHKEENENAKKFFERILYDIVTLRSVKNIELEPIIVTEKKSSSFGGKSGDKPNRKGAQVSKEPLPKSTVNVFSGKRGKIVSIDDAYNLVIIDLGRKDGINGGEEIAILKGGEEIARAQIINVRYKISAAFINNIGQKYSVRSITKGYDVLISE